MIPDKQTLLVRSLLFLGAYACTVLLPLWVWLWVGSPGPALAAAPAQSSNTPSSVSESPAPPGFLESLPNPTAEPSTENTFTLYDQSTGETFTLTAEELIPAAVACEMAPYAPEEALKAQAVACYTLFCRQRADGEEITCDSEGWLVWTTKEQMQARWGEDFDEIYARLADCARAVAGETLTQNGQPITAAYFAISCGSTEDPVNVWGGSLPCISPVASPGDRLADGYLSQVVLTPAALQAAAETAFPEEDLDFTAPEDQWLHGLTYTPSGYVQTAVLGGKEITGPQLRAALSLRSTSVEAAFTDGAYHLTVRGWGHGVGMSQTGAMFMAGRGDGYRDILLHYYPGAALTPP